MIKNINNKIYVIENDLAANSTLILGKKGNILVDTSLFPKKAEKIKEFSKDISGKDITLVINTHYHPDHTFGNIVFDCPIVANRLTREFMKKMDVDYFKHLNMENVEIKLPNVIFENYFEYEDGIKLVIYNGPGHTLDSSYIYIESEDILIAGDTIVTGIHPEIVPDSNLDLWLNTLENMPKSLNIVPGHGAISNEIEIENMIDYLKKIKQLKEGSISPNKIENDPNFKDRKHPELFKWSLENLIPS
ncbi:beta-lactamase [Thermosipho melanesiensis]|uniref:Beta-lactamase domain protein n=2 Tax=Thermosipho melanesiensis TaxID=46541 RepID=A6LMK6_THEM4|nr:MBL fold metallo-hydrolase [Thermosipho melanesiensis]ABR31157.1 beta-lactamase domain protein [Thermosipho melanesiensis BI429]APT74247.1 lactamase [Thermosipho melanesiensis]OOC36186.1 beta-lactamase [Thermosipho melanesiensis]OOC37004.1 beta-lactamase [Thermosipho melanesiensis]OOC37756.1 beta-lactamase [Thermosipho melanesiensis]